MKTFNELVKGDKIYRLQYQSYMDYNNNIIPYVETVDEFTIASSNNEIIGKENYRELAYFNDKEENGCYVPENIAITNFWDTGRYTKSIYAGICYSTNKNLLEAKRQEIIKSIRADIEKELNKIQKVEKQLLNILEDVK
jgi:hypothetical protein